MRKLLYLTAILIQFGLQAKAQVPDVIRTPVTPSTGGTRNNRAQSDANLYVPYSLRIPRASAFTLNGAKDSIGYVMFNTTSNRFGIYRGSGVWDTYLIAADIAGKANIANTLSGYGITDAFTKTQSDARYPVSSFTALSVNDIMQWTGSTWTNALNTYTLPLHRVAGNTFIDLATSTTPGYLSAADWSIFNNKQNALGFTPENVANKSTTTTLGTSNTLYPTQNAVKVYIDNAISTNSFYTTDGTITSNRTVTGISGQTLTFNNIFPTFILQDSVAGTFEIISTAGAQGLKITGGGINGVGGNYSFTDGIAQLRISQGQIVFDSGVINDRTTATTTSSSGVMAYETAAGGNNYIKKQTTTSFISQALSGTGLVKSVAGTISYITDNSTNWNTAFTQTRQWDGGSIGLVAATGRASLGLVIGTDVEAPLTFTYGLNRTGNTVKVDSTILKSKVSALTDYNILITGLSGKQATLVSGTNIKTINSASLLGSGNILLQTPLVAGTDYLAPNGSAALLTSFPTLNQNTTGSADKWTTGRTVGITGDLLYTSPSLDGSSNVTAVGTLATVNSNVGTFNNVTVNGKGLVTAASNVSYEVPLTFSTGLTRTVNTITVNTSQNITNLTNLNTAGFVKTTGVGGALSIDNSIYLTGNQSISFAPTGDVTGTTSGATTLVPVLTIGAGKVTNTMLAGSIDLTTKVTGLLPNANINSIAWGKITSTPTTITGYGITDFNSLGDARWLNLSGSNANQAINIGANNFTTTGSVIGNSFVFPGLSGSNAHIDYTGTSKSLTVSGNLGINADSQYAPVDNNSYLQLWYTDARYQPILGFAAESVANKTNNTSLGTSVTLYPTQNAVKVYVDNAVVLPTSIAYTAGATLPITLTSFQTSYSNYGSYPKFEVVINNGTNKGLDITSQVTISKGTATPPTTITINADDDGTGHLSDNILIIVKP
jgi:hypothetical protein